MINLDDYATLKRRAERLKQRAAEAEGRRKEILRRLKEEFGCETLEQAKEMLADLQEKERKLGARYTKLYKVFKEKWKDVLVNEDGPAADEPIDPGTDGGPGGTGKRR